MEKEYSLDPADWEELRRLGHRMLDDMGEYDKGCDGGNAGTVNTGAIDDLMELADSLSFDFHKWMYMNYEVG